MSCENCENIPIAGAFYRWGRANVEIIACREHWLEIQKALSAAQSLSPAAVPAPASREQIMKEIYYESFWSILPPHERDRLLDYITKNTVPAMPQDELVKALEGIRDWFEIGDDQMRKAKAEQFAFNPQITVAALQTEAEIVLSRAKSAREGKEG